MSIVTITAPAEEPVTVEEARLECKITGSELDSQLARHIAVARHMCETKTGRRLVTQTVEERLDAFPAGESEIRLSATPVQSITSVKYDLNDTEQTMDSADYVLDSAAYPGGWLLPAAETEWPDTDDTANCVRVRYVVGYGSAADVPAHVKGWILDTVRILNEGGDPEARRFIDGVLDEMTVWG